MQPDSSTPQDEFAAWLLAHRRYDVDVTTGVVTNLVTGCVVKAVWSGQRRYPAVNLQAADVRRLVTVHRLIAIKVWGLDACRGMEVAHLDGDNQRSVLSNLGLKTPAEHYYYDFTSRGRHYGGVPKKTHWPPCAVCGDPDGPIKKWGATPNRYRGAPFGIEGQLCQKCYRRCYDRRRMP